MPARFPNRQTGEGDSMKCCQPSCKDAPVVSITQKQGRRLKPCKPVAYCRKHSPTWALIAIDPPALPELLYYDVENLESL
jgi:hypothetical protein